MKCPICETEIDEDMKLAMNEDIWMNHCEAMYRAGGRPRRFDNIPEWLKTQRIKEYYSKLEIKIEKRNKERANEAKNSILEKLEQPTH